MKQYNPEIGSFIQQCMYNSIYLIIWSFQILCNILQLFKASGFIICFTDKVNWALVWLNKIAKDKWAVHMTESGSELDLSDFKACVS